MALVCKDSWDLPCSIKKTPDQFSCFPAQLALQMFMLQCRIWQVLFVTLLQALSWVSLSTYSHFQRRLYTFRSWHPAEFSQPATQAVWKLQSWAEVSSGSEQICCGTEGCPDTAMGSWCGMLCPAPSKHMMVHPPCQVWIHWQDFADPCRCAALHSPQAVPASHLALVLCLYLTKMSIHPQLLLLRNVLPHHCGEDTGCSPPSPDGANLSQHWAGPLALPWSEQIAQVYWRDGSHILFGTVQSSEPIQTGWETGWGPAWCLMELVLDATAEKEREETWGESEKMCISTGQLSSETLGVHCKRYKNKCQMALSWLIKLGFAVVTSPSNTPFSIQKSRKKLESIWLLNKQYWKQFRLISVDMLPLLF